MASKKKKPIRQKSLPSPRSASRGPKASGAQALATILQKKLQFHYPEHADLFETWWRSLSPETKRQIASAAEDFPDFQSYQFQFGGHYGPEPQIVVSEEGFRSFQESLPKVSKRDYEHLLQYSLLGRAFRPALLASIEEHGRRLADVLRTACGISDVR